MRWAALVSLLFFALPALDFVKFGNYAPFQFIESDPYYYLDVGRSSQHLPFYSFDGQLPTNGFHPLWQFLVYMAFRVQLFPSLDLWKTIDRLFFANLLILSFAVGCFAMFALRRLRNGWMSIWISCPGLLWFLCSHGRSFSGWSDLNGMETSVEMLFAGLALLAFDRYTFRPRMRFLIEGNIALSCLVLARLDDVFFLLPLTLLSLARNILPFPRRVLGACIPYCVTALYLLYNRRSVGVFLPISGYHKAGFVLLHQFRALSAWTLPIHSWQYSFIGQPLNEEAYFHFLQMMVPAIIAAAYLWLRPLSVWKLTVLQCLAIGVIAKAGYNFCFVDLMSQGHWYYAPSIALANLLLTLFADRIVFVDRASAAIGMRAKRYLPIASVCASVLAFGYLIHQAPSAEDSPAYRTQASGPVLAQQIRSYGDQRFVEFADGQIAFASGIPSVSGFGLTGDVESVHALEKGTFLETMARRGITLLAFSNSYMPLREDIHLKNAPALWGGLQPSELKKYYFKYLGGTKDVVFFRLEAEPNAHGE